MQSDAVLQAFLSIDASTWSTNACVSQIVGHNMQPDQDMQRRAFALFNFQKRLVCLAAKACKEDAAKLCADQDPTDPVAVLACLR